MVLRWARIAWWGLVSPRLGTADPLILHQGVVQGPEGVLLAVRAELCGWELPGGEARPGETGEEAVRREVLEETGVSVRVERRVAKYLRSGFRPHVAYVYLCRPESGEPRASDETLAVRWFDPNTLPATLYPWFRGPLSDALSAPTQAPPARRERWGFREILAGIRIDLTMRLRRRAWTRPN